MRGLIFGFLDAYIFIYLLRSGWGFCSALWTFHFAGTLPRGKTALIAGQLRSGPSDAVATGDRNEIIVVVPGESRAGATAEARLHSPGLQRGQDWGDTGPSLPSSREQDGTRGRPISIFSLNEARGLEMSQISILSRAEGPGPLPSADLCTRPGNLPVVFQRKSSPSQHRWPSKYGRQVEGVMSLESKSSRKSQVNTPQQLRCVWIQGAFLVGFLGFFWCLLKRMRTPSRSLKACWRTLYPLVIIWHQREGSPGQGEGAQPQPPWVPTLPGLCRGDISQKSPRWVCCSILVR